MSGHSKWASIKHKKGKLDAKRGQIFTKLIREITIAARMGGGDPDMNPRLRVAIAAAKAQNMPADNIERAIKRGTGELEGVAYEEVTYEGYGPGGVAVLVECQTDNKNRAVAEIRRIFSKCGGNLASAGAVSWNFDTKGLIEGELSGKSEDDLLEAALEAGADDASVDEGFFTVTTEPSTLLQVSEVIRKKGFNISSAKIAKIPKTTVKLTGKEAEQMLRLMESLEDADDTQNVWANFDIDEKEMESLMQ